MAKIKPKRKAGGVQRKGRIGAQVGAEETLEQKRETVRRKQELQKQTEEYKKAEKEFDEKTYSTKELEAMLAKKQQERKELERKIATTRAGQPTYPLQRVVRGIISEEQALRKLIAVSKDTGYVSKESGEALRSAYVREGYLPQQKRGYQEQPKLKEKITYTDIPAEKPSDIKEKSKVENKYKLSKPSPLVEPGDYFFVTEKELVEMEKLQKEDLKSKFEKQDDWLYSKLPFLEKIFPRIDRSKKAEVGYEYDLSYSELIKQTGDVQTVSGVSDLPGVIRKGFYDIGGIYRKGAEFVRVDILGGKPLSKESEKAVDIGAGTIFLGTFFGPAMKTGTSGEYEEAVKQIKKGRADALTKALNPEKAEKSKQFLAALEREALQKKTTAEQYKLLIEVQKKYKFSPEVIKDLETYLKSKEIIKAPLFKVTDKGIVGPFGSSQPSVFVPSPKVTTITFSIGGPGGAISSMPLAGAFTGTFSSIAELFAPPKTSKGLAVSQIPLIKSAISTATKTSTSLFQPSAQLSASLYLQMQVTKQGTKMKQPQLLKITQPQLAKQTQVFAQGSGARKISPEEKARKGLFPFFWLGRREIPLASRSQGYKAQALSGGKWRTLNKQPLPRNEALSLGARAVDETTSRRFRIIPSKGKVVSKGNGSYFGLNRGKFRDVRIKKGKGMKLPPIQYIEKTSYAIDTPSEKRGLKLAKWMKQRRNPLRTKNKNWLV